MDDIHLKLNKEEFRERTGELFSSYYMTTVSIVQGVALAMFIQNVFNSSYDPFAYFRVVISFLYIVTVTYEYATFAGIWRWPHRIWDVVIPLLLGVAQSAPSYFLHDPIKWWWASLGLIGCGFFAYYNTGSQLTRDRFEEGTTGNKAYEITWGVSARGYWLMAAGVPLCFVAIALYTVGSPGLWEQVAMFLFMFLIVVLFMWKQQAWYRKMHKLYGFKWGTADNSTVEL